MRHQDLARGHSRQHWWHTDLTYSTGLTTRAILLLLDEPGDTDRSVLTVHDSS